MSLIFTIPVMESSFSNNILFLGCPHSLIEAVHSEITLVEYPGDSIVFNEGDAGDTLYLVAEGRVKISKRGRAGQQETLGTIEAGNYFGEMALMDGKPRSARATTVGPTVLGSVSLAGFQRILQQAPADFFMNFLRQVVQRLRDANSNFIVELLQTERLSLVGSMAGAIIHDFKNPMNIILMAADFLQLSTPTPDCAEYTGMIKKALYRMLGMTQELLDFSRGNSNLSLEPCTAEVIIEELLGEAIIPSNIKFDHEVKGSVQVMLDRGRFVRVLANLVKNAGEAMPRGGNIRLTAEICEGKALFTVADNGPGIPPQILDRVFEPFVTHGKSNGTGLGMSIVKSIVEAHQGGVSIDSSPENGTRVMIRLPMIDAKA